MTETGLILFFSRQLGCYANAEFSVLKFLICFTFQLTVVRKYMQAYCKSLGLLIYQRLYNLPSCASTRIVYLVSLYRSVHATLLIKNNVSRTRLCEGLNLMQQQRVI